MTGFCFQKWCSVIFPKIGEKLKLWPGAQYFWLDFVSVNDARWRFQNKIFENFLDFFSGKMCPSLKVEFFEYKNTFFNLTVSHIKIKIYPFLSLLRKMYIWLLISSVHLSTWCSMFYVSNWRARKSIVVLPFA